MNAEVSSKRTSQNGTFHVRIAVSGSDPYPMRGGQGDYLPDDVLLEWMTDDGTTWTFRHAIVRGWQIDARTSRAGQFATTQTLYLSDPGYVDCEPSWLASLVTENAPGGAA